MDEYVSTWRENDAQAEFKSEVVCVRVSWQNSQVARPYQRLSLGAAYHGYFASADVLSIHHAPVLLLRRVVATIRVRPGVGYETEAG
jgi:hypothetical protein